MRGTYRVKKRCVLSFEISRMTKPPRLTRTPAHQRHDLVGVVDALAAVESQRVGECRCEGGRVGGGEGVGVGQYN